MAAANGDEFERDIIRDDHVTPQVEHVAGQDEAAPKRMAEPVYTLSKADDRAIPVKPWVRGPLFSGKNGGSSLAVVIATNVAPRLQMTKWSDDVADMGELATAFFYHHKRAQRGR